MSNRPQRLNILFGALIVGGLGVGAIAWSTGVIGRASSAHPASTAAVKVGADTAITLSANPSVSQLPPSPGADPAALPAQNGAAASTFAVSCFSAGCAGGGTQASGPRDPARVNAAIQAGNARAALGAGGDANDVLAAWASAEQDGDGRDGDMIALMQTGQTQVVNDDGELTVRSTLPNGQDLILRHDDTGADNGPRGPGG